MLRSFLLVYWFAECLLCIILSNFTPAVFTLFIICILFFLSFVSIYPLCMEWFGSVRFGVSTSYGNGAWFKLGV